MMTSTANAGDSLSILLTAFCEAACANPSITSAETASLPVSDIVAEADNETETPPSSENLILSFKSTMMRWAVFAPIPFTDCNSVTFSLAITYSSSFELNEDNIMRAVRGPITDILMG